MPQVASETPQMAPRDWPNQHDKLTSPSRNFLSSSIVHEESHGVRQTQNSIRNMAAPGIPSAPCNLPSISCHPTIFYKVSTSSRNSPGDRGHHQPRYEEYPAITATPSISTRHTSPEHTEEAPQEAGNSRRPRTFGEESLGSCARLTPAVMHNYRCKIASRTTRRMGSSTWIKWEKPSYVAGGIVQGFSCGSGQVNSPR